MSKTTDTTLLPEKTIHPLASPHKAKSKKHRNRNTPTTRTYRLTLRSDPNGDADRLPELLQIAQQRALNAEEAKTLADALRHHRPWLEWAGKQETKSFTVDPVALHIHERVSTKAILKVAERQNGPTRTLCRPATGL